jgi:hypothetical protein
MESRTLMGHNLIVSFPEGSLKGLRRVSKPTCRSSDLCAVLLTYWSKPLYEHRVQ